MVMCNVLPAISLVKMMMEASQAPGCSASCCLSARSPAVHSFIGPLKTLLHLVWSAWSPCTFKPWLPVAAEGLLEPVPLGMDDNMPAHRSMRFRIMQQSSRGG